MTEIPNTFIPIPTPLPPMLLEMASVKVESRFVALNYQGSKATWSDGRSSATFPFYTVWQPYIEHIAVAIYLFDYNLGSDDYKASHTLICDRTQKRVYIAKCDKAERFLNSQHPKRQPITPQQWEEIKDRIAQQAPPEMSQLQELGMFEMFMPSLPEHRERMVQLQYFSVKLKTR